MCTPAIADGLSNSMSASLHCSQESTSTTENSYNQMKERDEIGSVQSSSQVRNYNENEKEGSERGIYRKEYTNIRQALLEKLW